MSAKEARRIVSEHDKFVSADLLRDHRMLYISIATWYLNSTKRPANAFLDDLLFAHRTGPMSDIQYKSILNTFRAELLGKIDRPDVTNAKPWKPNSGLYVRDKDPLGPPRRKRRVLKPRSEHA